MQRKLLGINNVDFDATGQSLITVCMCQILEKKLEYTEEAHQLFIDFKKACDSVRRMGLYNVSFTLVSP
jgi:hypothetical protein